MATSTAALESDQLGPLVEKYGENPLRGFLGAFGVAWSVAVVVFLVSAAISAYHRDLAGSLIALALALISGAVAADCFQTSSSSRGVQAEIYERGLSLTRAGVTTLARWSDIASVEERILYLPVSHTPLRPTCRYRLALANGQRTQIDAAFERAAELGKRVQRMTTKALMPAAVDTYMRGEPVRFGRLSVTQWGIEYEGQRLLWHAVRQVAIEHGTLTISTGDLPRVWAKIPVAELPNCYLFTTLINAVPRS